MTYEQIAEWVEANFDICEYEEFDDLIKDVQERFGEDGMYFPPEAESNIKEKWDECEQEEEEEEDEEEEPEMEPPRPEQFEPEKPIKPIEEQKIRYPEPPEEELRPLNVFDRIGGFFKRLFRF